jgi:hypothetical protein
MFFRRPSPAMVVACTSLFVALGGTSIAAVNYARDAGKVDGKSAVRADRSRNQAAGKLVATYRRGAHKGQLAHRFLSETPLGRSYGRALSVADNANSAPVTLADTGSLGNLTTTCSDQNPKPGIENPKSTVSFVNTTGGLLNVAKRVGAGQPAVEVSAPGTVSSVTILGSNTFEFEVGIGGTETLVQGVVRQDGANSAAATCLVYGTALQTG